MAKKLKIYNDLSEYIDRASDEQAHMDNAMKKHGFDSLLSGSSKGQLCDFAKDHYSDRDAFQLIHVYIHRAHLALEVADKYVGDHNRKLDIEIQKQAANEVQARLDLWKLWAQRMARWGLGFFAAILLYSTAVYFTENGPYQEFFKIPGRDLLEVNGVSKLNLKR